MQMTFRWYGEGNDSITLEQIRQIPGVTGIVWALHHKQPGEVWEPEEIAAEVSDACLYEPFYIVYGEAVTEIPEGRFLYDLSAGPEEILVVSLVGHAVSHMP